MKHFITVIAYLALSASALAGGYVGEYAPGDIVDCKFGTVRPSTGASFTLGGTPAISAYKDNSTTQSTTGVTLTADFDSVTGQNHVRVTTSSDTSFYSPGSFFDLVITTGTVDSISVTGQPVCSFSLRKVNVGQNTRGTLSGTHSSTTADLGTNAPGATSQVAGMTLAIPGKFFSAVITSYNTGTGVATFSPSTSLTLADGDYWELWPTPSTVFGADSINAAAIADNAIDASAIAADAITAAKIAADAVGASEIAADAIGSSEVAADAIGASELAANAIGASEVADGAVDAGALAADAITAAKLAADVTTELQSGLATASSITTLAAAVAVIDGIVDQLLVGVNVEQMNGNDVCGTGDSGTPWTGCP